MKLSWLEDAKADLRDIRDYSIERSGHSVAKSYIARLVACAEACAARHVRLRVYEEPYRYAKAGPHFVFVSVDHKRQRLTVVRILHQSMDLARHLPDPGVT